MNHPLLRRQRCLAALRILGVAGLAILAGCAVNPDTGRSQLMLLPAAQSAHANAGYALAEAASMAPVSTCQTSDGGKLAAGKAACPSAEQVERFARQVDRAGEVLAVAAREFAPKLFSRVGGFDIEVRTGIEPGTASSAGGRIAISSNLAALDPSDDVVAFMVAREMGHVIARHGEENSGVRMAASVLTAVLPIGGLVIRFVASVVGAQAMTTSWAESQRREADELALALLERCQRSPISVAFSLRSGLRREHLPVNAWGVQFAQSIERVGITAFAPTKGARLAVANNGAPVN
jgi:Zn-dependent protease with chaperone function